jgi:translation initiation factor 1
MAKGRKLDLFIGSDLGDGWAQVEEKKEAHAGEPLEPGAHRLVFRREKRRGRVVTLVGPFSLENEAAQALLKSLKKRLGSGGTYKDGWMEFQGEMREKVRDLLEKEGYRFKR